MIRDFYFIYLSATREGLADDQVHERLEKVHQQDLCQWTLQIDFFI